ncbi:hypothetical protein SAMN05421504_1021091 [Amycolatopsis xylanica]|uniref:ABC-2 type transport system permease protein n=1 Tax=Amycolatopsis xylanica TaxID=589385 RepID=A0A1H3AWU7_9PSEU|nr:hypothetical protein [Amycolatopsis xylanica]SDX34176.1 hypothetical protein SAMN05421504_1021091 [Amycolatopsis xylanica]
MLAVARYNLALLGHSQRYLPASILLLGVLGLQYTERKAPVLPEFAVSAGALLVVSCWLTIALIDVEDPVQRLITLSHARKLAPVLAGAVLTVLLCAAALTVISESWAFASHLGDVSVAHLGLGALAHLACACAGIAIGLPCSRLLIGRIGWTLVAAIITLIVVMLTHWLPIVNPMLRALAADVPPGPGPVLIGFAASVITLVASAGVVGVLVHRRA